METSKIAIGSWAFSFGPFENNPGVLKKLLSTLLKTVTMGLKSTVSNLTLTLTTMAQTKNVLN